MSSNGSDAGPDDSGPGSWASETLPLSVRRELLERELRNMRVRKAVAQEDPWTHEGMNARQEGDGDSPHPQAETAGTSEHGD